MAISLPYKDVGGGCAVVLDDELHLLGSSTNLRKHYKWNGHEWSEVSSLPYDFCYTSAVVYNNEIHIIGSNSNTTDSRKHYKWNGTSWVSVSSLPFNFMLGSNACVYNNEIHIIALSYHYKWNGSSWVTASTPPYQLYTSVVIVYGNALHIIGGTATENRRKHYKWNGTTWTNVSTPPMDVYGGCTATVYNNELHILGGDGGATNHYKWNGTAWTSASTLPMSCRYNATATYHNCIHTMGSAYDSTGLLHYKWDGETWAQNDTEPEPEPEIELTVDDGYKNIRIRDKQSNIIFATQEILDSIEIKYGCTDGSAPAFGATYSPHCDVEINSNEIVGNNLLNYIRMGRSFVVECELTEGTYQNMGTFEINTPPIYTDDYSISFSGEGILGSLLARKKMNWALMSDYDSSKKGIITLAHAIQMLEDQFGVTVDINPNTLSEYSDMKIVVPLKLRKWKKGVKYEKQFVKITGRSWIAGISAMLLANVIEYNGVLHILTLFEAGNNTDYISGKYFGENSYVADYQTEKIPYAPKSMILNTYETIPVTTKKKNSSTKKTHGYCYVEECSCASIYQYSGEPANEYDVTVDCQWIGRSFESYYFNSGNVDGKSGDYEDGDPIPVTYGLFSYTPCTFDFSGYNSAFEPAKYIRVKTTMKNTENQTITEKMILVYIMEMTFSWRGTISVTISSAYTGDAGSVTITIGDTDPVSSAWNNGTNIPEMAEVIIATPEGQFTWTQNTVPFHIHTYTISGYSVIYNNELHIIQASLDTRDRYFVPYHYKYNGTQWVEASTLPMPSGVSVGGVVVYNGYIHIFSGNYLTLHYVWDGSEWSRSFDSICVRPFVYNGTLYDACHDSPHGMCSWNGNEWVQITDYDNVILQSLYSTVCTPPIFDGVAYFITKNGKYYTFDGTSLNEQGNIGYTGLNLMNEVIVYAVYKNFLYVLGRRIVTSTNWTNVLVMYDGYEWSTVSTSGTWSSSAYLIGMIEYDDSLNVFVPSAYHESGIYVE